MSMIMSLKIMTINAKVSECSISERRDQSGPTSSQLHSPSSISVYSYYTIPHNYIGAEFFYQHYPDEDHWRMTHPPPLDYPDTEVISFI